MAESRRRTWVLPVNTMPEWLRTGWPLAVPLLPVLVATLAGTWADKGVPYFVIAGAVALVPLSVVLLREGWTGIFTATALVSVSAYVIYCNVALMLGDTLVPPDIYNYPALGTTLRERSGLLTIAGCAALTTGLLLTWRTRRPVALYDRFPPARLFVPDVTLRNTILLLLFVFVGVRIALVLRGGESPLEFFLSMRAKGSYMRFADDDEIALLSLLSHLQVVIIALSALLLARSSTIRHARATALFGIAGVMIFAFLQGARIHIIGSVVILCGLGLTINIAHVRRMTTRMLPIGVFMIAMLFAIMTVFRATGFTGDSRAQDTGKEVSSGLETLATYEHVTMLEQCLYLTPEHYAPLDGHTIGALFVNFIPRSMWQGKPKGLGHILTDRLGFGRPDKELSTSLSAGLIGEGWMNFLMYGAIGLPFAFGLLCGAWDKLRDLAVLWPDCYAFWAAGLPGLIWLVRGDVVSAGAKFMYGGGLTLLVLLFAARHVQIAAFPGHTTRLPMRPAA